jgi:diguanylate cyclase (GGDEF)-like protein/PAS domain S-box-containing protein
MHADSEAPDIADEVSALIETLHRTEQRLEELTAGEVDTVADRDGRTFLLRAPQEHWRHSEAAKRAAILDALPAHIALLDIRGVIISANEAWCRFADANVLQAPNHGIGVNYLDVCDRAWGEGALQAHQIAGGIRSVLAGRLRSFSIKYPCHTPAQQRWFLLTVTPLDDSAPKGVIVMHLDVTTETKAEESLRASELRFRQMAENINEALWLTAPSKNEMLYVSPGYEKIWGRSASDLYASPRSWAESIHPEDVQRVLRSAVEKQARGDYDEEYRILRPDGAVRWIRDRAFPVRDADGEIYRIAGVAEDITERKRDSDQLRESERRFGDLLQNVKLISLMLDHNACITYCNDYLLGLTGWAREELIGRDWYELFIPPGHGDLKDSFAALLANLPHAWHHENEILTRSGERRLIRWNNSVLRSAAGDVIGSASIGEDITEQKRAEISINRLNRVYAVLSGINTLIVRVRNRNELFKQTCRIAVEAGAFRMAWIGVIDPQSLDGKVIASCGDEDDYADRIRFTAREGTPLSHRPACRALRQSQPVICNDIATGLADLVLRDELLTRGHKSAAWFPLTLGGRPQAVLALYAGESGVFDEQEMRLLLELAGDISFALDHLEQEEKLDYLAYYDVLTGLANRSLFLERLAQYMRSAVTGGHKLAVYLMDLERFKDINDSLGRAAGDALLRQAAQWLTRNVGDAGLVARVGPDQFVVVLPEVRHEEGAARLLESTLKAFMDHPFRLNEAVFRVAARAGVALFPDDGADADTLLRNAEAALKKAKAGRERYLFYTQKMTESVAGKLTLENQLRRALDNEEFVLHYQPKVNLASGQLTGAEALIRWNDPRTGLVPPGDFIPILEDTGLIFEVGRWAMRKAVEDYLRWRAAGLTAVRIAVNVSPLQLRNRVFIEELEQAIAMGADAAAGLELEITESVIMEDVRRTIADLHAIRAMGVRITIDDFGTGFSSLSYLSKLPVDTLKIDRSFIVDMIAGPDGLALVSTIINLAHSLKLNVVAEGVETDEQSQVLRRLSCDEMQGFLFSRPVPGDVFEKRFLTRDGPATGACGLPAPRHSRG